MTDAARLQELADREAIRQVFTDYARHLDGADYEGYASLFARDGVFGEAVGQAAIAAHIAGYGERIEAARREGRFTTAIHVMSNHDIEVSGDTATADVLWCYLVVDPDKLPAVLQMGRYADDLVREDGVWKIARHRISRIMGRAQLDEPEPSRLDAVRQRQQELEDREAIRQVFTDYARYLDGRDFAGYASLFARQGRMKASLGEAVGPEAILALLDKYREVSKGQDFPRAVHIVNNHDITLDGDAARAVVLWFYLTTDPDGSPIVLQGGRYTDELIREDGAWKLVSHDITRLFGRAPFDPKPVTRVDTIEQRLKLIEDKEAISRLFVDLSNCLDARDLKGYGALFTEDGEWAGVVGRAVGPAAITELLGRYCKPWESEAHRTYHTTVDMVIDVDGDTARATSKWQHIVRGESDQPVILHLGHYDDRLRRTLDGWRFTRRAAYGDIPYYEPRFQLIGLAAADGLA
ncbi:MAG: nuclear transport factor 2 family protein [Sphingomonas sp.]